MPIQSVYGKRTTLEERGERLLGAEEQRIVPVQKIEYGSKKISYCGLDQWINQSKAGDSVVSDRTVFYNSTT